LRSLEEVLRQKQREQETVGREVEILKQAAEIVEAADTPRTPLVRAADLAGGPPKLPIAKAPGVAAEEPAKRWP
jgi:hypothetical protein